jgi:hypothetical protein
MPASRSTTRPSGGHARTAIPGATRERAARSPPTTPLLSSPQRAACHRPRRLEAIPLGPNAHRPARERRHAPRPRPPPPPPPRGGRPAPPPPSAPPPRPRRDSPTPAHQHSQDDRAPSSQHRPIPRFYLTAKFEQERRPAPTQLAHATVQALVQRPSCASVRSRSRCTPRATPLARNRILTLISPTRATSALAVAIDGADHPVIPSKRRTATSAYLEGRASPRAQRTQPR